MRKRIEIYKVPVKEHERTYVRIIDEPEYEEHLCPGPLDIFKIRKEDFDPHAILGIRRRRY